MPTYATPALTAERLRALFDYDPETGEFRRRRSGKGYRAGAVAGTGHNAGYRSVTVDGKTYLAHRLAWLYVHEVWPVNLIDHINGVRDDNRFANLREATPGQNRQNRERANTANPCGFLGVDEYKPNGRWRARIMVGGRVHHLGYFATPDEAGDAYLKAKRELHPFWVGATTKQGDMTSGKILE